jgi:glyoxylase-like metal-dependent hydrolase (beta-lactamase superfamily II)
MFFRQIQKHGDNFSYIIADESACEAVVVDPSFNAGEIMRILDSEGFRLKYVVNTHGHPDHMAGNWELRAKFGAQIIVHKLSRVDADMRVDDGDVLHVGRVTLRVVYTPGHSVDSICLLIEEKKMLTGDTLFVGECGRTDLPGGNARSLYRSLFDKLLRLDDGIEVYPGHDYGPTRFSTIGKERRRNYTLKPRSLEEFMEFMSQP